MWKKIKYLFLVALFLASTPIGAYGHNPELENGLLDLREQADYSHLLKLRGEWLFYWNTFLPPRSILDTIYNGTPVQVPRFWNSYRNIESMDRFGYATYSATILLPPGDRPDLALKVDAVNSNYRIYINGQLIGEAGKPGISEVASIPEYLPKIYTIPESGDTLHLMVHVSNFSHSLGGIWKPLYLGDKALILKTSERGKVSRHSFMGIFFGVSILFIIYYLLNRDQKQFLFFALTSTGMFIRMLSTQDFVLRNYMDLSWSWLIRLEFLGSVMALVFGSYYLKHLFPKFRVNRLSWSIAILCGLQVSISLFLPVNSFFGTLLIPELLGLILLLAYLYFSFKGLLKGNSKESLFFFSLIFLILALIYDTSASASLFGMNMESFLPLAFFLVIAVQVAIMLVEWHATLREKASLQEELLQVNKNLESIIDNRTKKLQEANAHLNESLAIRNKIFSIIGHDLKSPVVSITQYTDILERRHPTGEDKRIINTLKGMSFRASELIDNLLNWGRKQGDKIESKPQWIDLFLVCSEIMDLYREAFVDKEVDLLIEIEVGTLVHADTDILKIVLRNIVSNALKFSFSGGVVTLNARKQGTDIVLSVKDNGVGMEQEKIDSILRSEATSEKGTAGEKGTGLGLTVVKDMIELCGWHYSLKSKPGSGTTVVITLPGKP